jgi:hypothetical protein
MKAKKGKANVGKVHTKAEVKKMPALKHPGKKSK